MQGSNRKTPDAPDSGPVLQTGIQASAPQNQNGLASARILGLLNQIGDKLVQSEQERNAVRQALSDLENRSDMAERMFLTIEDRVSKTGTDESGLLARQEKLEKLFIESNARLERAEALTDKIEEAIALQNRLARRLEKTAQDKARILTKIEHIEEGITQTREALSSKALIQLAEQVAAGGWLPPTVANDRLQAEIAAATPWWKRPQRAGSVTASLLVAGLLGGFAISQLAAHWPQQEAVAPVVVAHNETPEESGFDASTTRVPTATQATSSTNEIDLAPYTDEALQTAMADNPDEVAATLNTIEPGTGPATESTAAETVAPIAPVVANSVPVKAVEVKDGFDSDAFVKSQLDRSTPLTDRIKPDAALPVVVKAVEDKAFQGVPEAQHDLAAIYTAGHAGVTVDYKRAALWFSEAAANGIANARYNLGVLYHQGLGVDRDVTKAIGWYHAAAKLGHPEAQYNLGIAYIEGIGTKYDAKAAARYFEQSARGGVLEAAYNLGLIHENGLLGDADLNEAVYWYKLAADHTPEARVALNQLMKMQKLDDADVARIVKEYSAVYKIGQKTEAPIKTGAATPAPLKVEDQGSPDDPAVLAKSIPQLSKEESQSLLGSIRKDQGMIAQVQEQLIRLKLYSGPADGMGGEPTAEAISAYQKQSGLPVNGKPSEELLVRMMASEIDSSGSSIAHN